MSCIQLSYGVVEDNKAKINLNLPRNDRDGVHFKELPYLNDINDPVFQNSVVDIVNNRDDLRKSLLVTSNICRNIQENVNAVVTDGNLSSTCTRYC